MPVAEFKQNLGKMVSHIQSTGITSILLMAPPPIHEEGRLKHNAQVTNGVTLMCVAPNALSHAQNVLKGV